METHRRLDGGRRARALLPALALVIVGVLLAVTVIQVRAFVPWIPFLGAIGGRTVDNSAPAVLLAVQDMARYDAASGSFQVIVDLEQDPTPLPQWVLGKRWLFVAVGSVDSYIDFSGLDGKAIDVSQDRKTVSLRLPHAALGKPNIDHQQSHVFDEQRGVLTSVGSLFDSSPGDEAKLYQLGEQKIADAARQVRLNDRAEVSARTMLQGMMRSLGFERATITFA